VNRHDFDDEPDPTLPFDAIPDPNPYPSFTHVGKSEIFFTFLRAILVSGMGAIIFNILDSTLKLG
jgi:hypothetical protein